jgi:hypothetical protein
LPQPVITPQPFPPFIYLPQALNEVHYALTLA